MSNKLLIGRGYNLTSASKNHKSIYIPDEARKRHLWVFGTTGVGKTRLIESILEQDIPSGKTVIFIDPKIDIDIFNKIVYLAKRSNREEDLMLLFPVFPEYSIHFNPLKHFYMLEEQVGHIISGISTGNQPFFENVAYEISLALVMTAHLLHYNNIPQLDENGYPVTDITHTPFSLIEILNEMSHTHINSLYEQIVKINTPEAHQLSLNLKKIYESGQDYYNKVSSTLRVALMETCNGNIGQIIGKTLSNPLIDRLEDGKSSIFVVQLGSLLTRKASYTVSKIILSSLQAFIGRTLASGKTIKPALTIHIDEAQSSLYQGVDELFAKAGSANVFLHGYCQSISQLYSTIRKEYAHSILDNCNTKIFMRVSDSETAGYISKHFGLKATMTPIISADGQITFRDNEEEVVKPIDIMTLKPRLFYMLTYSGNYAGKTIDVLKSNYNIIFPDNMRKTR